MDHLESMGIIIPILGVVDLVIGEQIVKVVSCYAPQTGRSQIEKEEFWRQVEGVTMNTDINQEVIVGGDMNGHVGQVANGFHETHGNFVCGIRNAFHLPRPMHFHRFCLERTRNQMKSHVMLANIRQRKLDFQEQGHTHHHKTSSL